MDDTKIPMIVLAVIVLMDSGEYTVKDWLILMGGVEKKFG
jgi:hypothetical protein